MMRLAYTSALDPCQRCGAWKWEPFGRPTLRAMDGWMRLDIVDMLRCGECAHEIERDEKRDVLVGLD